MTRARRELVSIEATPYYHVISRCVRRAYLCGTDHFSGKNYEHRKAWVVERLRELDKVFTIDLCAYAVMSNHIHLVVRLDNARAKSLSDEALIRRWARLYQLPVLIQRYRKGECTTQAELRAVQELLAQWRARLTDLSWYMRSLNEHLARRANAEDGCTGRFWEGRFKSQALLDDAAVLTCMSYVDLNPIRAAIAETPETSDFTSIQQRIAQWKKTSIATSDSPRPRLMPLVEQRRDLHQNAIGFTLRDYLELVEWAGRQVRDDKRGAIAPATPPILERLGLKPARFIHQMQGKSKPQAYGVLGDVARIRELATQLGRRCIKGVGAATLLYSMPRCAEAF
jgi:REP element-mobilizing transposase RayT